MTVITTRERQYLELIARHGPLSSIGMAAKLFGRDGAGGKAGGVGKMMTTLIDRKLVWATDYRTFFHLTEAGKEALAGQSL